MVRKSNDGEKLILEVFFIFPCIYVFFFLFLLKDEKKLERCSPLWPIIVMPVSPVSPKYVRIPMPSTQLLNHRNKIGFILPFLL